MAQRVPVEIVFNPNCLTISYMFTRRDFLSAAAAPLVARPRQPNVIVMVTDDQGYHDLGCQGARELKTPHLDALATSGARFTDWYSNAPMCAPSRASLLTGRYPQRAGVPTNGPALPLSEQTIASLLKARGYSTALVGKWHLGSTPETAPNARGFDYFYGFHSGCVDFYSHRYYWGEPRQVNYHDLYRNRTEIFEDGQYLTELLAREAAQFITQNRSNPFFLYLAFNAPHYPMHAPRKYVERFPNLEPERQMYAAMMAAVDDTVGQVMGLLRKFGLLEDTLVIFASDNGATREPRAGLNQQPARGGSNSPLRGFKFSLFDGGIRMPAMLSWPGRVAPKQVISEVGAHMDLLPTICSAAGVPVPADRTIDGRDMLPVVTSGAKSPHDALFWASGNQLAVRRGRWKLVRNGFLADGTADNRKPLEGPDALFLSDVVADPGETRNLRVEHPAVAAELVTLAERWLEDQKRN